MLKEAVYHRPKNNFAYAYNEEILHIRLQTKSNDVTNVNLHFKDPFYWDGKGLANSSIALSKVGSNSLFDFWQTEIKPPNKRVEYFFELQDENEQLYFTERGFVSEIKNVSVPFKFPFINKIDVFTPPTWVKDTIWYQIFPERFANGDPSLDTQDTLPWGSAEPSPSNFFGGDLEGVIQNLDYLCELGINGIYFTPLFEASTNHKYDTIDYLKIDPYFGNIDTLKRLVKECHQRGIKVMLDAVFNHCGYYFKPFQDVLANGESSIYKDWFHIREFPIQTHPIPSYETFAFTHMMPKFNTENQEVKEYLLNVARFWIEECDIDGWRLDVANEVDHAFWREFRQVVKKAKKDVYILGEVWHDSMPWLQGEQFDAVMNYPFTNLTLDLFARNSITVNDYISGIEELSFKYPKNVNEASFNLLGSHDTPRVLNIAEKNKEKVKLAYINLLTTEGSPCIYYGDEISMDGENDPGCRKCMEWNPQNQDKEMFNFIKQLIQLRKANPIFHHGASKLSESNGTLVVEKFLCGEKAYIILNPQKTEASIDFPLANLRTQLKNAHANYKENKLTLPEFGYAIFTTTNSNN